MRRQVTIAILLLFSCLSGCQQPLTRQDCVGSYTFTATSSKVAANLNLNEDGTYTTSLVLADRPNLVVPSGHWKFSVVGSYTQIALERSSFPVARHRNSVRITINDDLGEWFENGN
jgi:hypothetical protein